MRFRKAIEFALGIVTSAFEDQRQDLLGLHADEIDAQLFGSAARTRNGDAAPGPERVSRLSRLHEALGGTLYLKNVAEAPTRVQGRLARLLRDREAVLVETGATVVFDIRMMAGVDPGVDAAVEDGRVRAELFKRLSVIRIDLPPLRNRREDIPALANYFLREICGGRRIPPKTLSRPVGRCPRRAARPNSSTGARTRRCTRTSCAALSRRRWT